MSSAMPSSAGFSVLTAAPSVLIGVGLGFLLELRRKKALGLVGPSVDGIGSPSARSTIAVACNEGTVGLHATEEGQQVADLQVELEEARKEVKRMQQQAEQSNDVDVRLKDQDALVQSLQAERDAMRKETQKKVAAMQAELEQSKHEFESMRQQAEQRAGVEAQLKQERAVVQSLQAERDSMCKEAQKKAAALQVELKQARKEMESMRQQQAEQRVGMEAQLKEERTLVQSLQAERDAITKEMQAKIAALQAEREQAKKDTESMRQQHAEQMVGVELQAERDAIRKEVEERKVSAAQCAEAQKQIKALEEENEALNVKLAKNDQQRRRSLSGMSENLAQLSQILDRSGTSWTPWNDINNAKDKLEGLQVEVGKEEEGDRAVGA